ncbi:MAG: hypothetical protein R3345_07545, partial [Fulvivirga sp.]|nr:hypothetical protein [Fulvivirga sp.]
LKRFYGFKTYEINLGFNQDKLNYLDIYFRKLDDEEFEYLLQQLEKDFGEATPFTPRDKGISEALEWRGDHLKMQLYRYNQDAVDHYDRNMTVLAVMGINE